MVITVRKTEKEDLLAVFELVKDLAIYENAEHEITIDLAYYQKSFDENIFESIVAEDHGTVIGTCIFYMTFSTWKGRMLYLEDFVVKEAYRQSGVGQLLFDEYIRMAKEKGCALAKWQVLDWNDPAVKFYKKNDATIEKEWWNGKIIF